MGYALRPMTTPPTHDPPEDETPPSDFARALEEFERGAQTVADAAPPAPSLTPGARVRGRVVALGADHALLDVGARSEATADLAPFRDESGAVKIAVGDALDLFVVEAGDQIVLAPSVRAETGRSAGLDRMRAAREAGMPVSGKVTGVNAGGLQVDLGGVRGFCPVSQVESGYCAEPASYVGRSLEFLVTGLEENRRGVVLSRRQLLRREEAEVAKKKLAELSPGAEMEGTVKRLEPFGAFVDIGGVDGMVHVSEIRHERVKQPGDVLRVGEKVRVRVLRIERGETGRQKIALSIKAAAPDPWEGFESRYAVGARVTGTVAHLAGFGAFVTLEPGIEGLVHVSELSHRRVAKPSDAVLPGQRVEAVVLAVDPAKKRISLSLKAASDAPDAPEPAEAPPPPPSSASRPARAGKTEKVEKAEKVDELGPMAIAFRKAAERARQKDQRGR